MTSYNYVRKQLEKITDKEITINVKYLGVKLRGFGEWIPTTLKPKFNSHSLFQPVSRISAQIHSHAIITLNHLAMHSFTEQRSLSL